MLLTIKSMKFQVISNQKIAMMQKQKQRYDSLDAFAQLMKCIEEKQITNILTRNLYRFIKSNPNKQSIEKISEEIAVLIKDSSHYRLVTDLMVIVIRFWFMIASNKIVQPQLKKYLEKVDILHEKLKNSTVKEWITKIYETVNQASLLHKNGRQAKQSNDSCGLSKESLKKKIDQYQQEILKMKSVEKQIDITCCNYKIGGSSSIEKIVQIEKYIYQLNYKYQDVQSKYKTIKNIVDQKENLIVQLNLRLDGQNSQFYNDFAVGSEIISPKSTQEIIFLKKTITEYGKVNAKKCRLLLTSSQSKYKDVHGIIDNKPNILLVAQLTNGIKIGGFTKQEFKPQCSGQFGCIFNLTKLEVFERVKGSSIAYDSQNVVFGNNQMSISLSKMEMRSDIGNKTFNTNGKDIQDFNCKNKKEPISLQFIQIYQVQE